MANKQLSALLPVPVEVVERHIFYIRDRKAMLDRDLAELYGVTARALRQQVKRNQNRFPPDFIFQLTRQEADLLVSQSVTPNKRYSFGGSLPYAFTEQGVAMLSSVLTSERAIQVNMRQSPRNHSSGASDFTSQKTRPTRKNNHCLSPGLIDVGGGNRLADMVIEFDQFGAEERVFGIIAV